MSGYSNGADLERRVCTELTRDGYVCVRAAGSKGATDVVATKPGQVLFIQAKLSNPQISPSERAALVAAASRAGAVPLVVSRVRHGRGYRLVYRRLTGVGAKEWVAWTSDEVAA